MTGLPRLAFGTAVLTAERVIGRRTSPASPVAVAVGLTGLAASAANRAMAAARRAATPDMSLPRLRDLVRDAGTRGAITMARSRRAAQAGLRDASDNSLTWAERSFVPRVVEDLLPYFVHDVAPKVIDGVMPRLKEKVIPAIVEDLADDPKMREFVGDFVRQQGESMLTGATLELRETSADADDKVESTFRRMFRNGSGG